MSVFELSGDVSLCLRAIGNGIVLLVILCLVTARSLIKDEPLFSL